MTKSSSPNLTRLTYHRIYTDSPGDSHFDAVTADHMPDHFRKRCRGGHPHLNPRCLKRVAGRSPRERMTHKDHINLVRQQHLRHLSALFRDPAFTTSITLIVESLCIPIRQDCQAPRKHPKKVWTLSLGGLSIVKQSEMKSLLWQIFRPRFTKLFVRRTEEPLDNDSSNNCCQGRRYTQV